MHQAYKQKFDTSTDLKPEKSFIPRHPAKVLETCLPGSARGVGKRGFEVGLDLLGKQHEITQPPPNREASILRRFERFEVQNIAAEILEPHKTKSNQSPRVCKCLRVPRANNVEVWKSAKNNLAYYGGLVICGSVWDCLPCAQKISEYRANEIKQAVESWEAQGGSVTMLTLTFPHYENQKCKPLRDKFQIARGKMKNRKNYKRLMKQIGLVGDINRTEVTYGLNGWHVHCHTLLFSSGKVALTSGAIFPLWASACESAGLPSPSRAHGVSVATPKEKADYISKQGKETSNWTLEKEMTKGHIKRGGMEGLTPFDLLRAYRDTNDDKYKVLFVEYSQTFKGTRQLVWSDGLRDLLHLDKEITDEQAAESQDELDELLAMIEPKLWKYIRENNYRAYVLESANSGMSHFFHVMDKLQTLAGYVDVPF